MSKKAGEFRFIAKLVKGTIPWKNCGITLQIIGPADVIYFVPAIANLSHLNPKKLFIILFGLYLLLGMHFFMDNVGGYGLYIPANIAGWILVGGMIGLGLWRCGAEDRVHISRFALFSWLGFILLLVPVFYTNNEHSGRAALRLWGLAGGLVFYFSLAQFQFTNDDRRLLLFLILGGAGMEACFALVQYYHLAPQAWYGYRLDPDYPSGIFQQRNLMASFLATGCAVSLYLLNTGGETTGNSIRKWLIYGVPFLCCILFTALNSKTGYLGFALALLFLSPSLQWKKRPVQAWILAAAAGFLIGAWTPQAPPAVQQKVSKAEKRTRSIQGRQARFETTFQLWQHQPFSGAGYGAFPRAYRDHHAYRRAQEPDFQGEEGYVDHPHNELLFWLAEGGLIPFLGLMVMAGAWLIMVLRLPLKDSLPCLALVTPILLHTQVEFPFYHSLVHWIVFLTLAYFPDAKCDEAREYSFSNLQLMKIPAVLIPTIVGLYMAATLQTAYMITRFERTDYKDPELLHRAWNPRAWHLRYEVNIMNMNLDIAYKTANPELLQKYVDWGRGFVRHSPFLYIYYDMAAALRAMGKEDESWEMINKARYLYPDTQWLKSSATDSSDRSFKTGQSSTSN